MRAWTIIAAASRNSGFLQLVVLRQRWFHSSSSSSFIGSEKLSGLKSPETTTIIPRRYMPPPPLPKAIRQSETVGPLSTVPEEKALPPGMFRDFKYDLTLVDPFKVKDERFVVEKASHQPLVLIFGWAGAQQKHLAKYSRVYQEAGCNTLAYILPSRFIFLQTVLIPHLTARLMDVVSDLELLQRPLYIHNLSDTGNMCYQGIHDNAKKRNISLDLKGVVYDSCPAPRPKFSRLSAFLLVDWIVCRRDGLNILERLISIKRLIKERVIPNLWRTFKGKEIELSTINGIWAGDYVRDEGPRKWPELFFYSNTDFYLPYKYMETVVLPKHREAGRKIYVQKWKRSPHVGHLREHKEDYIKAVHDFLFETHFSKLQRTKS